MSGCGVVGFINGFVSRGVGTASIDDNGHLIFSMTDGESLDLGKVEGDNGYSPVVTVEEVTGGHNVTITDETHPQGQTFNVMDGEAGPEGPTGSDGSDGADGVSPEVMIETITGGHSVTITDAEHPSGQTFNVMDGETGPQGPSGATAIDDTTTANDKLWSSSKVNGEINTLSDTIFKLSDGGSTAINNFDCDTAAAGEYFLGTGIIHGAVTQWAHLSVRSDSVGWKREIMYDLNSNKVFVRVKNTTWTSWTRFITQEDNAVITCPHVAGTKIGTDAIVFKRTGNILFATGYFQISSQIAEGGNMLTVTGQNMEGTLTCRNNNTGSVYYIYTENTGALTAASSIPTGWYVIAGSVICNN